MSCESGMQFNRRQVLGMGLATLLGLSVRDLIASVEESASSPTRTATADHVILLWMAGGMSHIDTFDPKPGRATAGDLKPIRSSMSGVDISEILPKTAAQLKHATLIRSLVGTEADHDRATYNVLTSYKNAPQLVHPSMGSIVTHELQAKNELPAFVSINGRALSAGYLGIGCEAYYIGSPGQPDPYIRLPEDVPQARADRRLRALAELNARFSAKWPDPELRATDATYHAAKQFMQSPALVAFELDREPEAIRAAYGETPFGRGCLLAKRLVEQGVRFVQVNYGGFDTHQDAFPAMRRLGSTMDPAIGSLIGDLAASGKLERTLVVVLSEFGRTPEINATAGRDHHREVFSTLLAGGGIKRGLLLGASDADGEKAVQRPVRVGDLHATICAALGIDPKRTVDTPLNRPMRLVDEGQVIQEILQA